MDLKQLCEINAVCGNEERIRRVIMNEVSRYPGVSAKIDRVGNVVCEKKSGAEGAKHVLVTAPMDEIGFMVMSATGDGFLRISPIGRIDSRMAVSKRITIGEKEQKAVIGSKPIHLQTPEDRNRVLPFKELYADIGAKTGEEALSHVPKGSYCAFDTEFISVGDGFVSGKALSGRACVYNLLRLLNSTADADVTAVFTTLRSGGGRGAAVVPFSCQPDYALVLSSCLCNDMGSSEGTSQVSKMGDGVSITFMDKGAISSRELFRKACETAEEKNVPHQMQRGMSPAGEAGQIQHSSYPLPVLTLSLPCRNMNTPCEVMKLADISSQLEMTLALINSL